MAKMDVFGTLSFEEFPEEYENPIQTYVDNIVFPIQSEVEHKGLYFLVEKEQSDERRSNPPMAKTLINYFWFDGQPFIIYSNNMEVNFCMMSHIDWDGNDISDKFNIKTVLQPILLFDVELSLKKFEREYKPIKADGKKVPDELIYENHKTKILSMIDFIHNSLELCVKETSSNGIILDNLESISKIGLTVGEMYEFYKRLNQLKRKYGVSILN